MQGLPKEVEALVLSFLPLRTLATAAARVCRAWRALARDPFVVGAVLRRERFFSRALSLGSAPGRMLHGSGAFAAECSRRLAECAPKLPSDAPVSAGIFAVADWCNAPPPPSLGHGGVGGEQPRVNAAAAVGDVSRVSAMLCCGANAECSGANGATLLMCAAAGGHTDVIRAAVAESAGDGGADVNRTTADGISALMYAAQNGHAPTAAALLALGADPTLRTSTAGGLTALYLAAQDGHAAVVAELLRSGAVDVDTRTGGATPLLAAATYGHADAAAALVAGHADVNARDAEGWSPLLVCVRHPRIVELLLANGADVEAAHEQDGTRPLLQAAQCGARESVQLMLAAGANPNAPRSPDGSTPLMHAAEQGHSGVVSDLLGAGADPDTLSSNGTALVIAVESAQLECVLALLSGGANPNRAREDGTTALMYAATYGHREVADALLQAGAAVDATRDDKITALMYASERPDNDALVEDLLRAGANPDAVSSAGYTALFPTAIAGNRDTAALLLRWGASPDLAVVDGLPALAYAAVNRNAPAVALLLDAGADPNRTFGPDGRTALIEAATLSTAGIVADLLTGGASPTVADRRGKTPLMAAAERLATDPAAALDVMRSLLRAGADVNTVDSAARTALHVAVSSAPCHHRSFSRREQPCDGTHLAAIRLLLSAGADTSLARHSDGTTPLMVAARSGCAAVIKILLRNAERRGAGARRRMERIIQEATNGWTALHFAAAACRTSCVSALLDAGADPNHLAGSTRKTPLLLAIEACNDDKRSAESSSACKCSNTTGLLISRGAMPNHACSNGDSPLIAAVRRKSDHGVVIEMLLDAGACVVHSNDEGASALTIAASFSCSRALSRLLKRIPPEILTQLYSPAAQWLEQCLAAAGKPCEGLGRCLPPSLTLAETKELAAALKPIPACHPRDCPHTAYYCSVNASQRIPASARPTADHHAPAKHSLSDSPLPPLLPPPSGFSAAAPLAATVESMPSRKPPAPPAPPKKEKKPAATARTTASQLRMAGIARAYGVNMRSLGKRL